MTFISNYLDGLEKELDKKKERVVAEARRIVDLENKLGIANTTLSTLMNSWSVTNSDIAKAKNKPHERQS